MPANTVPTPGAPTPPPLPPAGWYTNPLGPAQRYWDATYWTDRTLPPPAPAPAWLREPELEPWDAPRRDYPVHASSLERALTGPSFVPRVADVARPGHGLTIVSFVLAAVSLGIFPIITGPAAIVCAGVALNRKEPNAAIALAVAIVALIVGMFIGAVVGAQSTT
jgi:hypothetical protein